MTCSKNTRPVNRRVEHLGQRELGLQHRELIPVAEEFPAASVNGFGSKANHLFSNACIAAGPSRSQIACNPAGSSTAAKALSIAVNPILAFVACRRAQW